MIWLSIGIIAALGLGWWVIGQIRLAILDEIARPDSRAAIESLLRQTSASFRTYVLVVLVIAALAGLLAFIIAHLDWLTRAGRWMWHQVGDERTPLNELVTVHYDGLRAAGFVVAATLLLVIGIGIVPFLVIGGLIGVYFLVLGATRRESPAAASAQSEI